MTSINNNSTGSVAASVYRPLALDPRTGFPAGVPDNAILNIVGVVGPSFTVGGRALLFADGSSTTGGTASITLQASYQNSIPSNIDLIEGRDFIIDSPTGPGISFKIDSVTGAVTIGGDLIVSGTQTSIHSVITQSDNIRLDAQSSSVPALVINPSVGQNAPIVDLVIVSIVPGSTENAAFRIDAAGITSISTLNVIGDVTTIGKINGVDLAALQTAFNRHLFINGTYKHLAKEINIDLTSIPGLPIGPVRSVQSVLDFFDISINSIDVQVQSLREDTASLQSQITQIVQSEVGQAIGLTFLIEEPLVEWVIQHNKNSRNFVFTMFDGNGFMFTPDSVQIVDENLVSIKFATPQAGQLNMIFYTYTNN